MSKAIGIDLALRLGASRLTQGHTQYILLPMIYA